MAEVTRTELNQQTARVLARVAAGEHLMITDRGRRIAELTPVRPAGWELLVATGKIRPARVAGPLGFDTVAMDVATSAIVADIRRDRE